MAITATLTVSPASPAHGATLTAVYAVQGNDPVAPQTATIDGSLTVGSETLSVTTTVTLPGDPAEPVSFAAPTCPGLTFSQSSADPTGATWTAIVP